MKLTYYGHACIGIETNGKQLLFDPFISGNELAAHIDIDSIPADFILISHGHQDHVLDAEAIARRTGALIISTFEVATWFGEKGLNAHPMNHGGQRHFDFGTLRLVNAVHSSVLPDGTYGGNPCGFVIHNEEGCFYHAADTALTWDMKLIPMIAPPLDFAILPIGDNFTMGYQDAVLASQFIECKHIVGCHYDTFGYIKMDHEAAQAAFKAADIQLQLPAIGETLQF
jgi:L-ascorbate metabolism protein UlaG (beta-lactamase superfamily)